MRKISMFFSIGLTSLVLNHSQAQVSIRTSTAVQTTLPSTSFDRLRVEGGLLTHFVSGTIGSFGATDKWIGTGAPLSSLYGNRIQWNGQALNTALREESPGGTKNALIEWGNGGGEMQFRYITNPNVSTSFNRILSLTPGGSAYVGNNQSNNFIVNSFLTTPVFQAVNTVVTPKFEINETSNSSNSVALGAKAGTGIAGYFKTEGSPLFSGTSCVKIETGPSAFNGSLTTSGMVVSAKNGSSNIGIGCEARGGVSTTGGTNTGINGVASGGFFSNGISGSADNANNATGVSGSATNSVNTYGIFGSASSTVNPGGAFAGYFNGRVIASSYSTLSDQNFKTTIEPEASKVIDKINSLRPVTYYYNNKNLTDLNLPSNLQHGFIAQELQKVFPEFIVEANHPIFKNGVVVSTKKILSVNYNMLISVLTKAIQEEDAYIKALEKRIEQLEAKTLSTASLQKEGTSKAQSLNLDGFELYQNTPNPFSGFTTIRYSVPSSVTNASIAIFDLNGKMLLQYTNLKGKSQISIEGSKLSSGMYLYSLLNRGEEIITKKMIVSK